jgi:hypothetical protein
MSPYNTSVFDYADIEQRYSLVLQVIAANIHVKPFRCEEIGT